MAKPTILVTGATGGIGEAIARAYAGAGAAGLVMCGRNEAKGSAVAREIGQANSRTKTIFVTPHSLSPQMKWL